METTNIKALIVKESNKHIWCVIYRVGGTDNFQWHRSSAMTREEAENAKIDTMRFGYPCFIENFSRSCAIGLPEGYDYPTFKKQHEA